MRTHRRRFLGASATALAAVPVLAIPPAAIGTVTEGAETSPAPVRLVWETRFDPLDHAARPSSRAGRLDALRRFLARHRVEILCRTSPGGDDDVTDHRTGGPPTDDFASPGDVRCPSLPRHRAATSATDTLVMATVRRELRLEHGLQVIPVVRMSDARHDVDELDTRHLGRCDFARREVREHTLAVIRESVLPGDADGLSLDFGSTSRFFDDPADDGNAALMTGVVRRARAILDLAGRVRGRRLPLHVRVNPRVETCRDRGLHVAWWVREGLVDAITPDDGLRTGGLDRRSWFDVVGACRCRICSRGGPPEPPTGMSVCGPPVLRLAGAALTPLPCLCVEKTHPRTVPLGPDPVDGPDGHPAPGIT